MNKKTLVAEVAKKAGTTKKEAQKVVDAFIEVVSGALAKGEKVRLVGFGSFVVKERAARKGVNPRTKKAINIPAKKIPKFVPGKELKEKVG
ncbi:MAG: DNA-binding protein HU-beta [Thermotogaceae bacterium]|jgi:DNA-binding protein HU-beta|nr:DNA-binding protein HU-beta [Thermotogaceae bacterium]MDN5337375.1 DNA-binding protein HU-beta [Thermotogaceae bacterium]